MGVLATTYQPVGITRMKTVKPDEFEALDWTGCPAEVLEKFFPTSERCGKHHPPPHYDITSSAKVRKWRKLGGLDQRWLIENPPRQTKQRLSRTSLGESRESSSIDDRENENGSMEHVDKKPRLEKESDESTPAINLLAATKTGTNLESTEDDPICNGISLDTIEQSKVINPDVLKQGFRLSIGNAYRWTAEHISNGGALNLDANFVGYLVDMTNGKNCEPRQWKCTKDGSSRYCFRRVGCEGSCSINNIVPGTGRCKICTIGMHNLFRLFRQEVALRKKEYDGRVDLLKYKSPSMVLPFIRTKLKQIQKLQTKVYGQDRKIEKLDQSGGMDLNDYIRQIRKSRKHVRNKENSGNTHQVDNTNSNDCNGDSGDQGATDDGNGVVACDVNNFDDDISADGADDVKVTEK